MESILGLNIPLKNSLINLVEDKWVSSFMFQVCCISEIELQCKNVNFFCGARNAFVTTGTIYSICCDAIGF
jgi:hypothetical protein